jgi:O-acetyl-ADP-ribose deacetylase (regulator of RNase III)
MSITYIKGDITQISSPAIIVHGVNCQKVMGSGVAKAIRERWPLVYDSYLYFLALEQLPLGRIDIVKFDSNLFVINAFTQEHYGRDGRKYVSYDAVESCFKEIEEFRQGLDRDLNDRLNDVNGIDEAHFDKPIVTPVYFPRIGAGLGGGNWNIIESIINETLTGGGICVELPNV